MFSDSRYNVAKFVILGIPTWALVDGTWASLSQLVNTVPEGYEISSYLILSLTIGNLVPLMLGLSLRDNSVATTKQVIGGILIIGLATGLMMSLFWKYTVGIYDHRQFSLPLCLLFFVVGACSSASNVTHFTFVSHYPAVNTSALATGMGLGSMVSGLLAILQGTVLNSIGFSISYYYLVLSLLYVPALVVLFTLPDHDTEVYDSSSMQLSGALHCSPLAAVLSDRASNESIGESPGEEEPHEYPWDRHSMKRELLPRRSSDEYSERDFLFDHHPVLLVQFYNAVMGYGLVPALVSVACSRFNNRTLVLLLATGITAVIDPILKAVTAFVRLETLLGLQLSACSLTLLLGGLLLCTTLPVTLSLFSGAGGVFPIALYVSFGALFGFSNTCVYRYFKANVPPSCMRHSYRWGGMATQSGALVGSLLAFYLIVGGFIK
jgi:hypothetical protein